ncbi:putative quinol monooxygenase [Brevibacterium litoralis]|uniref:putative quinol monooxygenase n=1 Tax=Brevibacterium litoralis TaxID=3138935 RepID=UPI0032EFE8FE
MYAITVKFTVKPESVDSWPEIVRPFTEATRAEEGNLWFEWSKSLENPQEYILIEAFTDEGAAPHVQSGHFSAGLETMKPHLESTPQILSRQVEGDGWDTMGELQID